jgi:radical SAM superfamily enzyme YgiQ (UPF0313 family)
VFASQLCFTVCWAGSEEGVVQVLLVNANRVKAPLPVMPFGLCCVASATERAGHRVSVLDLCFSERPANDIARALERCRPDLVGVSVRNLDNSAGHHTRFLLAESRSEIVEPLRGQYAGPIVVGGPPVGINGRQVLEYLGVELGIRGDGELAFVELLERLAARASLADLGGLVWQRGGRLLADNPPRPVEDLDSLPPVRLGRYVDVHAYSRFAASLPVQSKRGCPLSCAYCTYHLLEGKVWRLRDPERVAADIEQLVAETGIRRVELADSVFNLPLDHAKAVLRAISRRGMDLHLHAMGLNPGAVDEELVDLMVQAGFRSVDVGAESSSDITLAGLGKSYRKEALQRTASLLRSRGLAVHWFLLVGGPGETPETLRETLDAMDQLAGEWDLVDIGVGVRVYNGSALAKTTQELGRPSTDEFFTPRVFEPEGVTIPTLKRLTKERALERDNYFMYDEDRTGSPRTIRLVTALLSRTAPDQPAWRCHIAHRKVLRRLGILALRRWWFRRSQSRPSESA